jgi:hypothetical protein
LDKIGQKHNATYLKLSPHDASITINHISVVFMTSLYPVSMDDSRLSEFDIDDNVRDGIEAVIKTTQQRESCMWTYLRDTPPDESRGYMFSKPDPVFEAILKNMQVGHSGGSYGWTMRNLQYIASHGLDAYVAEFTKPVPQSTV